ncbi:MAG TPA: transglutaminase domain-containing protein [Candidatus Acidoferrales bacterium]
MQAERGHVMWIASARWATSWLAVLCALLLAASVVWELQTRRQLHDYAARLFTGGSAAERVESFLHWMEDGAVEEDPATPGVFLPRRDPLLNLNSLEKRNACGTATNAFVNVANTAGIPARRLLLLDGAHSARHVVAEVLIDGRWVVADPLYRALLRDASGRLLSKEQLRYAGTLREATSGIAGYPPEFTYDRTAHVRLAAIPVVGLQLRALLDRAAPGWEESVNWTLYLERSSTLAMMVTGGLLLFCVLVRIGLGWYGRKRMGSSGAVLSP